mmetsp:Transcript_23961/g.50805  ORF Transcript_23961/g.50805 Transcript_23961/m.50805 type:complete len:657 (+) Transcript_23961:256-2226(+)
MKVTERIRTSFSANIDSLSGGLNNRRRSSTESLSSHKSSISSSIQSNNNNDGLPNNEDEMFLRLRREAAEVVKKEPILCNVLSRAGLLDPSTLSEANRNNSAYYSSPSIHPNDEGIIRPAKSFEEVISRIVSHRLSSCSGGSQNICPSYLCNLLQKSFASDELEMGHTMSAAVREDAMAVVRRDPAVETLLEAVLFMKGFHSLVLHRAARRAWKPSTNTASNDAEQASNNENGGGIGGQRFVALLLQSQASASFGVDIHPASSIGSGVMIDHASGVVIGETARVGDGTTILHAVTLGGTGKDHGDRHPKIGKDVLIGAGTKILGNITVGDRAKIGAGSVVLRPIPSGATAVGAPAKIIGYTPRGERPGSSVDMNLLGVEPLLGKTTTMTKESSEASLTTADTVQSTASGGSSEEASLDAVPEKEEGEEDVGKEGVPTKTEGDDDEEINDDDDDDDEVTDFGTPAKCRWKPIPSHKNDTMCPFSGSFRHTPKTLTDDSISHAKLRALLIQEGCTEGECVEVFFQLLHATPATSPARQCGCIPLDTFSERFPEVARERTRLDGGTIRALAAGDLRALGMSKKASRRFRSMFTVLDSKRQLMQQQGNGMEARSSSCGGRLPRIPSSGSLSSRDTSIRHSEKEQMSKHLDTHNFREAIAI